MSLFRAFYILFFSLVDPVANDRASGIKTRRAVWAKELDDSYKVIS